MTINPLHPSTGSISSLQGDAWASWNASYHQSQRDIHRDVARMFYEQDMRERITTLFARLDEQNACLDRMAWTR